MALPDLLAAAGIAGPSVVTIGTFDGVHLGHQHLMREVARRARAFGAASVALTFHPRPSEVLRPEVPSVYLCSLNQRRDLLRLAGADAAVVIPFDRELSLMGAAEFSEALVRGIGMRELVGGPDLALGHRRQGTPDVLRQIGATLGFEVGIVPGFEVEGEAVRTSAIRLLLSEADLQRTEQLLGRRFSAEGIVVRGAGRGSTIGIPTANVETSPTLALPANGVYAVYFTVDGARWAGAGNLGVRPTFDGVGRSLEVHLLDFSGDLYDRSCEVEFVARLRPERRFTSADELVQQIRKDVEEARRLLT